MKQTKPQLWIFFYEKDPSNDNKLRECIGSGSICPCDKRLSINTIAKRVLTHYYSIPTGAVAFAIHVGDRLINARRITHITYLMNYF